LGVLERLCRERGAPLSVVGHDWHFRPVAHSLEGQTFEVWSDEEERQLNALRAAGHTVAWRANRLELGLLGAHQVENAAVAYGALMGLRRAGLPLAPGAIADGMRAARWPGRFEVMRRRPYLVVDGAHNADSARRLAATLLDYFPGRRIGVVFGASADKDVAGMFAELLRPEAGVGLAILTQAVHPRALEPEALAQMARPYGVPLEQASTVGQAIEMAQEWAGPDDVILACGSLFVVAEARSSVMAQAPLPAG
jgi:dihydrofolate synthase/folylpolyglutamate synthase